MLENRLYRANFSKIIVLCTHVVIVLMSFHFMCDELHIIIVICRYIKPVIEKRENHSRNKVSHLERFEDLETEE